MTRNRVLLVSTYEMGHQPMGLAAAAAVLREAEFRVDCADAAVAAPEADLIVNADLIAVSVPMHTAARLGVAFAERARALNPDAHVAFYGLYASTLDGILAGSDAVDSVVGGEYEGALLALAQAVRDGRPTQAITGLGASPTFAREQFVRPDRAGLPPLTDYARFTDGTDQVPVGYVEASRGCAHTCTHCPITPVYQGRLRLVQPGVVLADIDQQVAAGARHITFGDPDFLNAREHALSIVEAMHERHPAVTFDVTVKVEHILEHRDVLPRLAKLGAAFVTSAFESLDDEILGKFRKGHTAADLDKALAIASDAGIPVRPTWVAFTPWTSVDGFLAMLAFIEGNGLVHNVQPVQYALRLLLPPGPPLAEAVGADGLLGGLNADELTYEWKSTDPRSDALQREIATVVGDASDDVPHLEMFAEVKRLAVRAGTGLDAPASVMEQPRQNVPGLTEAWFC